MVSQQGIEANPDKVKAPEDPLKKAQEMRIIAY